jgi:hypothetical protein
MWHTCWVVNGLGECTLENSLLALANRLIASALTRFGVGISMIFALWAGCGVIAALTMTWVSLLC